MAALQVSNATMSACHNLEFLSYDSVDNLYYVKINVFCLVKVCYGYIFQTNVMLSCLQNYNGLCLMRNEGYDFFDSGSWTGGTVSFVIAPLIGAWSTQICMPTRYYYYFRHPVKTDDAFFAALNL